MAIRRERRAPVLIAYISSAVTDKILIVGSSGPISSGLAARLAGQAIVIDRGKSAAHYFDLEVSSTFGVLAKVEARHAVFLSALTGFQPCADDPARAFRTNVKQTTEAVDVLNRNGIPVTLISSSAVFGVDDPLREERAAAHPGSVYGSTKHLAEVHLLSAPRARNSVVRLTELVDKDLPILKRWRDNLNKGEPLVARRSLRLAPVPLPLVVDHLQKVIGQGITGVNHLTSDKDLSYYELAEALFPGVTVVAQAEDVGASVGIPGEAVLAVSRAESEMFDLGVCVEKLRAR